MTIAEENKCYSSNSEEYHDDIDAPLDEVLEACDNVEEAMQATISVGNAVRPNIKGGHLTDWLIEKIGEDLYACVGEYSEHYEVSKSDRDELNSFLTAWIDKQDFRCYSVENVKDVPITDFIEASEIVEYFK